VDLGCPQQLISFHPPREQMSARAEQRRGSYHTCKMNVITTHGKFGGKIIVMTTCKTFTAKSDSNIKKNLGAEEITIGYVTTLYHLWLLTVNNRYMLFRICGSHGD
jgi:hypothetical protein